MSETISNEEYDNGYHNGYAVGYKLGRDRGYSKGRKEAIDEFWTEFDKQIKTIGRQAYYYTDFLVIGMKIREQLKEQNK